MAAGTSFTQQRRRPRPALIALIALFHVLAIYGLAKALAPNFTGDIEREIMSTFTVPDTIPPPLPAPPPPPLPTPQPEPDEGAAGAPGMRATPRPVIIPAAPLPRSTPAPKASSTGKAETSGARNSGEGTGAAGSGQGTGSGRSGTGQGSGDGGAGGGGATKPVLVSGGINSAADYPVPSGGRQARFGTRVVVKITVGTDGRATNCSIFRPSPDTEADRITCRLVTQRLRFEPAKDAAGNPVAAAFYWQQKWSQADR